MVSLPATAAAPGNTLYVGSSGSSSGDGSAANPFKNVQAAYDDATDGDTIQVLDGVDCDTRLLFSEIKTVTLSGADGAALTYTGSTPLYNGTVGFLTVTAGDVTISNLTVQLPAQKGTNGRVLAVENANVTLRDGAALANGYLAYGGGGVRVGAGGTLTMEDSAEIRDCYIANNTTEYGGGVQITDGGSFTMAGGTISGNTIHTTQNYKSYGGGVAVLAGGEFTMTGGDISGNLVDTAAAGLYIAPGATVRLGGNLTISGNTASGAASNLYLPDKNSFGVIDAVTGAIGVTCGNPAYEDIIGTPDGYAIAVEDKTPFTYDDGAYSIRLKNNNLVLYWYTVDVTFDGDGITSTNPDTETEVGKDYDTVLTPEPGQKLPDEIDVSVDGEILTPGENYTYDPDTGAVHIPGENVTGDIEIDVSGDGLHTLQTTVTNLTADMETTTATSRDTVKITFTPAAKYALPDAVTVTGTCDHAYENGVLTLTNITTDVMISATAKEIHHQITLDPNGGEVDPKQTEITESQPQIGALPLPVLEGYTFVGWLDPGGNRITAATANNLTADLHLTASWSANTNIRYGISHWLELVDSGVNPNHTEGETPTQAYGGKIYYHYQQDTYQNGVSDRAVDLHPYLLSDIPELSMDGVIPNADNVYSVTTAPDSSSVFPLFYRRAVHTVTSDPNGGDALAPHDAIANVTYGSIYGVMPAAVRTGYSLIGWFTAPDGGKLLQPDSPCMTADNHTLYAHWQSSGSTAYTVIHKLQPLHDNLPSTDHGQYEIHQTETLTGTSDTTVEVYALAIPGFKPCADNPRSIAIAADGAASVTLCYDRLPVRVSYDANGGGLVDTVNIFYTGGTLSPLPTAPIRTGHTFTGWYLGKLATDRKIVQGDPVNDLNPDFRPELRLFAQWNPRTYNVPLDAKGGMASGALTVTYGRPIGTLPTALKPDHIFTGWQTQDGKTITADMLTGTDNLIVVTGNTETAKTLYAQYTSNQPPSGGGGGWNPPPKPQNLTHTPYIFGYPDATVRPDGPLTRAEAATIFYRQFSGELLTQSKTAAFPDADGWYRDAVSTLSDLGILTGYPDGTFRPNAPISRAEFTAIAARFANLAPGECNYPDVQAAHWAYGLIASATEKGWISGYPDGTFRPDGQITRAEAVKIMNALLQRGADIPFLSEHPGTLKNFADLSVTHWGYAELHEAVNPHDYSLTDKKEVWKWSE